MKAIMVMYDSLNLHMLEPYGCDWTHTPNFARAAQKCAQFCNNYVGSMPCMPARRELHTGRCNFLHHGWGPLEPYDDSMPELLGQNGIHTHLISDHQHYWEDGGGTYHTRYSTWENTRGQEGDPWKYDHRVTPNFESGFKSPMSRNAAGMAKLLGEMHRNDAANRALMPTEADQPQSKTFALGLEFLETNHDADNWFLQIETFDPHEPFFTQQQYKDLYPHEYDGPQMDWPPYYFVQEDEKSVNHVRMEYAALLSMCDANLGKVLDFMDAHDMWQDTMLIINTDHGYLLGEHGWWSKTVMPLYDEIAHTPLFIYDPRSKVQGEKRQALTQTIDLAPTLLDFFGVPIPPDMQGKPLARAIACDEPVRDYALYGFHGAHVNVTDGHYTYMKAPATPENGPLYGYTLMPTHMRFRYRVSELQDIRLAQPFSFTKGCRVMQLPPEGGMTNPFNFGTCLYNIDEDPGQLHPVDDVAAECRMLRLLVRAMQENDAPSEQYTRLGVPAKEDSITEDSVIAMREAAAKADPPPVLPELTWDLPARHMFRAMMQFIPADKRAEATQGFAAASAQTGKTQIGPEDILAFAARMLPPDMTDMACYFLALSGRVF